MVVSLNRGPQYRPQYTVILILGTPKKVALILGNCHIMKVNVLVCSDEWNGEKQRPGWAYKCIRNMTRVGYQPGKGGGLNMPVIVSGCLGLSLNFSCSCDCNSAGLTLGRTSLLIYRACRVQIMYTAAARRFVHDADGEYWKLLMPNSRMFSIRLTGLKP